MAKEAVSKFLSSFLEEKREVCHYRAKLSCLFGITLVPLFCGLDYVVARPHFEFFLFLRLLNTVENLIIFAILFFFKSLSLRTINTLTSLYFCSIALMIAYMCQILGGYESTYYAGICIVLMVMCLIMPWQTIYTILNCLLALLGYVLIAYTPSFLFRDLFNNLYFMTSMALVAVLSTYWAETLRFKEFIGRQDLKVANDQLKSLDEAKTRFFSNVSHELRTSLALIQGPLMKFYQEEEIQTKRDQLALCIRNVNRLLNEVNDLLDFAKLESGRMPLNISKFHLEDVVQDLVEVLSPLGGVRPVIARKEALPEVFLDKGKVEKIIANLIGNAIKFSQDSGKDIEVDVFRYDETYAAVVVRDFGAGMPAEKIPHIFERFYQGEERVVRGTGIGLTMVKEYAELHKGRVEVESELGKGTSFTILLPLGKDWAEGLDYIVETDHVSQIQTFSRIAEFNPHASAGQYNQPSSDGRAERVERDHSGADTMQTETVSTGVRRRVLIVDDEPDLSSFMKSILEARYEIAIANNGQKGLETIKVFKPDLVLSDLMMPEMNGHEMTQQIRKNPDTFDLPVILLTANAANENMIRSFQSGVNDFLPKPFHVDELLLRVDNQIRLVEQKHDLKDAYEKLKATETELVHAQKLSAVGTLASGIAHHLNNALFSMSGQIESLSFVADDLAKMDQATALSEEVRELHETMQKAHDRARGIVDSLLNFSSTNRPTERLIDINREIEDTLVFFDIPANHEVTFKREYGPSLYTYCYVSDFTHSIMSVFQNAIAAIKEKGKGIVWIRTSDEGEFLSVRISNDGPPIPLVIRDRIFDAFFSTKPEGSGDGLGLALAAQAVERQGGSIRLLRSDDDLTEFEIRVKKNAVPPKLNQQAMKKDSEHA